MALYLRLTSQMDGTPSDAGNELTPSAEDSDHWLSKNDPFTTSFSRLRMRECLSMVGRASCLDTSYVLSFFDDAYIVHQQADLECMLSESMRVCSASGQADKALVDARLDVAQHTAEVC
jgi:hypothetical protein